MVTKDKECFRIYDYQNYEVKYEHKYQDPKSQYRVSNELCAFMSSQILPRCAVSGLDLIQLTIEIADIKQQKLIRVFRFKLEQKVQLLSLEFQAPFLLIQLSVPGSMMVIDVNSLMSYQIPNSIGKTYQSFMFLNKKQAVLAHTTQAGTDYWNLRHPHKNRTFSYCPFSPLSKINESYSLECSLLSENENYIFSILQHSNSSQRLIILTKLTDKTTPIAMNEVVRREITIDEPGKIEGIQYYKMRNLYLFVLSNGTVYKFD